MNHVNEYQALYHSEPDFWQRVGLPSRGIRLYQLLHQGIPYPIFTTLAKASGLEIKKLAECLSIPQATLQRRARLGRFKVDESDRLYRFAVILKAAIDLFEGDEASAQRWLQSPVRGLGGHSPLEMMATSAESQAVQDLIGRLEQGVFA